MTSINLKKLCKIADKWCAIECHVSVYPYRPEWGNNWRNDINDDYEVVTNDIELHHDKLAIGIIVSRERYENMDINEKDQICKNERDIFIGMMIALERDVNGIRLYGKDTKDFVNYLKDKCAFNFYDNTI